MHGAGAATPPPQLPAVQISPVVQSFLSSQPVPVASGEQVDGSGVHDQHGSSWHSESQPSPSSVSPSKHSQRMSVRLPMGSTLPESTSWVPLVWERSVAV